MLRAALRCSEPRVLVLLGGTENTCADPVFGECWVSVVDGGPMLKQHWVNVLCFEHSGTSWYTPPLSISDHCASPDFLARLLPQYQLTKKRNTWSTNPENTVPKHVALPTHSVSTPLDKRGNPPNIFICKHISIYLYIYKYVRCLEII